MKRRALSLYFLFALGLSLCATALAAIALAATAQENALRDGCKKYYNDKTQKEKYKSCVEGKSPRSNDALIEGCYARYRDAPEKLRQCVGR